MLIVGLGNPGKEYRDTRHNLGRIVVEELGRMLKAPFTYTLRYNSYLAKGHLNHIEVTLMLPETYMNESGLAVGRFIHYHKLPVKALFVVVDDADIPFGTLRLRHAGSTGGHNGLKSIEQALQTKDYTRLRCGIGRSEATLHDHVLSQFTKKEKEQLPHIVEEAIKCLTEELKGERNEGTKSAL